MKGITLHIDNDEMSATLTIVVQAKSEIPKLDELIDYIRSQGIEFGLSQKRISKLLHRIAEAHSNTPLSEVIAKGLQSKDGKNSFIQAVVPNVFDRFIAENEKDLNKEDINSLNDSICVFSNDIIAKRMPPTSGRPGKTITGKSVPAIPGKFTNIILGDNTKQSDTDENLIIASIAGQAKFENGVMSIEKVFIVDGVNFKTGNVKNDGAVIVNGDVTENMKVIAKGDVTINGFVESAYIYSEGDIIITEGASGKMQDADCQLVASGNIYIQHAQGISITAGKEVNIAKQLAYSSVSSKGGVTVGVASQPMGSLFASTIKCSKTIMAGSLGAISGSELVIDFSEEYEIICTRLESINDLQTKLSTTYAKHENRASEITKLQLPEFITNKLNTLKNELDAERALLAWLQETQSDLQKRKENYEKNAQVIANKELFPGITIKLNKVIWRSEREYQKTRITMNSGNWHVASIN